MTSASGRNALALNSHVDDAAARGGRASPAAVSGSRHESTTDEVQHVHGLKSSGLGGLQWVGAVEDFLAARMNELLSCRRTRLAVARLHGSTGNATGNTAGRCSTQP